ncbi:MAG: DNA topoisomerase (ATP-hydrolyzing) [Clostridia bacterium]
MAKQIVDNTKIVDSSMEDVLHNSMMPYSEYVILDRALPRVEDGLKPVQRRILFTMLELGLQPDKPFRKSARIVGDCLGKYHPHGDTSVYSAMVRMAQDFNLRNILVEGHGNFGSIDGDSPAAMRYTEAKLTPLAMELLRDIDKETVTWSLNFDDTMKEPNILPGRYPNLLVNGANGIAVGLATNIPTHNLNEVIEGTIAYINNPNITLAEMMQYIKAPDFPSGGSLIIGEDLVRAYETGKGKIIIRSKISVENDVNGKVNLVVTEMPYQVNKANLLVKINKLREDEKETYACISDIVDESDRNGMRAVIKLRKDANVQKVVNMLYKQTELQTTFNINMVAIAGGKPQQLGLLQIIDYYVKYQIDVIVKRTQYDLTNAKERAHILEGLIIAIENIEQVVKILKKSKNNPEAVVELRKAFALTERQAKAILDMRLSRLIHMEIENLQAEIASLHELIIKLEAILSSKRKQKDVVISELKEIAKKYKTERFSNILSSDAIDIKQDSAEKEEKQGIVVMSYNGNLKVVSNKNYATTNKDLSDANVYEIPKNIFENTNLQDIIGFTNLGNAVIFNLDDLPDKRWKSNGIALSTFNKDLLKDEFLIKIMPYDSIVKEELYFYTQDGIVKKSKGTEYEITKNYFQAVTLKDNDSLINVEIVKPNCTILFATEKGIGLNAETIDIPLQGRKSSGVKCIQLNNDDKLLFAGQIDDEGEIVIVSNEGAGKKVINATLDIMKRYRKGVKLFDLGGKQGDSVVFVAPVKNAYDIAFVLPDDTIAKINTDSIPIKGKSLKGITLYKGKFKQILKQNLI